MSKNFENVVKIIEEDASQSESLNSINKKDRISNE